MPEPWPRLGGGVEFDVVIGENPPEQPLGLCPTADRQQGPADRGSGLVAPVMHGAGDVQLADGTSRRVATTAAPASEPPARGRRGCVSATREAKPLRIRRPSGASATSKPHSPATRLTIRDTSAKMSSNKVPPARPRAVADTTPDREEPGQQPER